MLEKARGFVVEKDLVELPPVESAEVIETPPHLKPYIPFATYIQPKVFHYSSVGYYYI